MNIFMKYYAKPLLCLCLFVFCIFEFGTDHTKYILTYKVYYPDEPIENTIVMHGRPSVYSTKGSNVIRYIPEDSRYIKQTISSTAPIKIIKLEKID